MAMPDFHKTNRNVSDAEKSARKASPLALLIEPKKTEKLNFKTLKNFTA
jgi:hypothetical protein